MKSMFERAGYSDAKASLKELTISVEMPSVVFFPNVDGKSTTISKACDASDMFRFSHFRRVEMWRMKFSGVTNFDSMCAFNIAFSFEIKVRQNNEFEIINSLLEASKANDEAKIQEALLMLYQNKIVLDSYPQISNVEPYLGTDFYFNVEKE